jgi:tripartite-type tricarboxylate transporter receptor subunit TctC
MKRLASLTAAVFALAFGLAIAAPASADQYPSRTIHLVVGFPPGGINDIVARLIAPKMSQTLGQTVVVENRPGAGGTIGAEHVAQAEPDGYTLLLGSVSNLAMASALYKSLPYDSTKDFAPIALVAASPNIMVVNPAFPVHTVKDLIKLAKEKPGTINYASAGIGTSNHLTVELLKVMTGINIVHVPFKGDTPAVTAVLANQVPMMFPTLPVALPYIKSGKLRAVAVSSAKRSSLLPDVPTVAESAGLPEFAVSVWVGVVAPPKTPQAIVEKLNTAIRKAADAPDTREHLAKLGVEPDTDTPAEFASYIASETKQWSKVARSANIKPN